MRKYEVASVVAAMSVLGFGLFLAPGQALAADTNGALPTLLQRIIDKFGLNKDQVDTVVDDYRTERRNQMKTRQEERLNQAVEDGVISEAQKTALLGKMEEMRTQMEQKRTELEQWFKDQGIDMTKLRPYGGFGLRGGMGMKGMHGGPHMW